MDLVVGATGLLGGNIAGRLLEQGRRVRILVRPGRDASELVARGAEPVEGDLKDPESLRRACRGVERVVTTANSSARGGEDTVETVEIQGNRNLVEAAREEGVRRFLFVSALGADPASPVPFIRGKALAEAAVRNGGMEWTILAPTVFMDVWVPMLVGGAALAGAPVTLVGEGRTRHSFIAVDDVAAFAVAALDDPGSAGHTVVVGGAEGLSWNDVVGTFERVLGRPVEVRRVAPGEPLPGLPPVVSELAAGFEFYESMVPMEETARRFGVRQTSLEEFVRGMAAGTGDGGQSPGSATTP